MLNLGYIGASGVTTARQREVVNASVQLLLLVARNCGHTPNGAAVEFQKGANAVGSD